MLLNSPKNLEEYILSYLQKGSYRVSDLIEDIKKYRSKTTKQGVYASLRSLRKSEAVVLHGGFVSLNTVWLDKMSDYFSTALLAYTKQGAKTDVVLNLQDGDSVQYFFQDPVVTDAFWSHVFFLLIKITPTTEPVFLYNPHEWFLLARAENEKGLMNQVTDQSRLYLMTVGSKYPLDRYVSKYFDVTKAQYFMSGKKLFLKENYYLNIVGDYLIEVWFDPVITKKIEEFFKRVKKFTVDKQKELQSIITLRGRSKLKVSRNNKKTVRLKKMLSGAFYFPR